jgi:hypothetical protein
MRILGILDEVKRLLRVYIVFICGKCRRIPYNRENTQKKNGTGDLALSAAD